MSRLSLRRLRQDRAIRELTKQVRLSHEQMIQPYFLVEGISEKQPIEGLSGVFRETPDSLNKQVESDLEAGVHKILLFGVPKEKSHDQFSYEHLALQIQQLRQRFGNDLWIATDVCLCSATTSGHCGVFDATQNHLNNEVTVAALAKQALVYAQAGANCVAPSDMMDGRVRVIRKVLDEHSLEHTIIMSYSAKFHSSFYGPFRNAADSAPKSTTLKDRSTYQIDPTRPNDALACAIRDQNEGADILMVKPGLPYLDIVSYLHREIPTIPIAVYQVSGEYAAIDLLSERGLINRSKAHVEAWTAFVRAGASILITYGARHAKNWLREL